MFSQGLVFLARQQPRNVFHSPLSSPSSTIFVFSFQLFYFLYFTTLFHHASVPLLLIISAPFPSSESTPLSFCFSSFSLRISPCLLTSLCCFLPLSSHPDPVVEDEGNLGLVILLVLFSVVILTTVLSLIFVVW